MTQKIFNPERICGRESIVLLTTDTVGKNDVPWDRTNVVLMR